MPAEGIRTPNQPAIARKQSPQSDHCRSEIAVFECAKAYHGLRPHDGAGSLNVIGWSLSLIRFTRGSMISQSDFDHDLRSDFD
jgi:hypothetical protein